MTVHKRAKLVSIARAELAKRSTEHDADSKRYEPPAWLLAALESAYDSGYADGQRGGTAIDPRAS